MADKRTGVTFCEVTIDGNDQVHTFLNPVVGMGADTWGLVLAMVARNVAVLLASEEGCTVAAAHAAVVASFNRESNEPADDETPTQKVEGTLQ